MAAPKSPGVEPVFGNPAGYRDDGVPAGLVTLATAIVLVVVGLVWMIRIYRADPEPDQRAWRYRERD